jgi:hypothetical protein
MLMDAVDVLTNDRSIMYEYLKKKLNCRTMTVN